MVSFASNVMQSVKIILLCIVAAIVYGMHPSPDKGNGQRESVYVVFNEGCDAPAGQAFLGLVDGRQAMLFPHRIFADLLRPWQLAYVGLDTPLEKVQKQLLGSLVYSVPVVDGLGGFLGAVTRDSVLKVLLAREEKTFQALKQGLDLQERQRNLIAFEIHDGLVQYAAAVGGICCSRIGIIGRPSSTQRTVGGESCRAGEA